MDTIVKEWHLLCGWVVLVIAVVIFPCFVLSDTKARQRIEDARELQAYEAWSKYTKVEPKLTFKEWKLLKEQNLLKDYK